jgi:hypothetical protein
VLIGAWLTVRSAATASRAHGSVVPASIATIASFPTMNARLPKSYPSATYTPSASRTSRFSLKRKPPFESTERSLSTTGTFSPSSELKPECASISRERAASPSVR